ncbi:MAG: hypothetical protein WCK46_02190 [Candidatus Adlerbacteria bacterium]
MDSQISASFIPKKPLDSGKPYREGGGFGLFFFIALFIFIVSLVAAGGVFGYQTLLASSLASKSDSLAKAEGAFDISTIQDLIRMDSRINNAQLLLQNHVAPSAIFNFLGSQTLQAVQFVSLTYNLQGGNSATVVLAGQADSFATVALQSDQFSASKVLKNVVFSDIKVGLVGKVTFNVTATVDPSLINYTKNLGVAQTLPQQSAPASGTTPNFVP